ncbi:MAG: D-alanyl-D-alanine carboxypeptidase [Lachnospiraceae bacterium]|nr:D-alanyl-D-alanine carboxypeptidase [Lachnospiraceae bacterium]
MMHFYRYYRKLIFILSFMILIPVFSTPVYAVNTVPTAEQKEAAEERKFLRVESNEWEGWPEGPVLGAESAILMDFNTETILYSKNIHERLYPASTTKMMTALLTIENTSMDEVVTFSHDAIHNIDSDSSRIGIDVGEELTVEQCLYGLMLGSANEVAYALAEHVAGSLEAFVDMMNERAEALGCSDTHFINANGLPDEQHYTSAYDLALIARECYKNEAFANISGTRSYTIPATNIQSQERIMDNHHQMVTGFKYQYDGFIGGKTGYTKDARQTLVSCAERGGIRLICVIMKEESPNQFVDTMNLFDYGFDGFGMLNIKDNENRYTLDSSTFFNTDLDIMGSSKQAMELNDSGYIILPKTAGFFDAEAVLTYSDVSTGHIATLDYYYSGNHVGSTTLDYAQSSTDVFEFANILRDSSGSKEPKKLVRNKKTVFVNVKNIILILASVLGLIILVLFIRSFISSYSYSDRHLKNLKRNRYKKRKG